ncbi:basic proline-rich protein-like [Bos taurus]|uniref:basic proline-rich protein-like n=1 Tax=Bos taurus TaxID=9913 RepID=UPI0028CB1C76|nr:basic proline-rich protein-like [Bos taurus]
MVPARTRARGAGGAFTQPGLHRRSGRRARGARLGRGRSRGGHAGSLGSTCRVCGPRQGPAGPGLPRPLPRRPGVLRRHTCRPVPAPPPSARREPRSRRPGPRPAHPRLLQRTAALPAIRASEQCTRGPRSRESPAGRGPGAAPLPTPPGLRGAARGEDGRGDPGRGRPPPPPPSERPPLKTSLPFSSPSENFADLDSAPEGGGEVRDRPAVDRGSAGMCK